MPEIDQSEHRRNRGELVSKDLKPSISIYMPRIHNYRHLPKGKHTLCGPDRDNLWYVIKGEELTQ